MGDVVSNGSYKFAGVIPTEIGYLSGVSSNMQTELNSCVRDHSATTLLGNIVLSYSGNSQFAVCGATPTKISLLHGLSSNM